MATRTTVRAPALLLAPAIIAGALMLIPFVYLVLRASNTEAAKLAEIVLRPATGRIFLNTVSLMLCVVALTTAIALPLAFLLTRTELARHRWLTLAAVMPLAIPGYVMAYALIGLSGYYGPFNVFFGIRLPRLEGLPGATLALSLYTFPYVFLNLRSALLGLDAGMEESARSLGRTGWETFRHVTLPHLRPALLSSWLVVSLYVLGDYGAIALMRFDVFSSAIYSQYANSFEVYYAAWLSLMLLALAGAVLAAETLMSRRQGLTRAGTGSGRRARPVPLGRWRVAAWGYVALVQFASLGVPVLVLAFWLTRDPAGVDWAGVLPAMLRTIGAAAPTAAVAVLVALPVALVAVRHSSRLTLTLDRLVYFGYAVPPLPFALAMVFFTLTFLPFLYQTLAMLVLALALHTSALMIGPLKSRLLQIGPRVEESARSFGYSPAEAFRKVTLPRLARSLLSGAVLVFIVAGKELPMTLLLAPTGYTTMATAVFSRSSEGMLVDAAPYAVLMIAFSSLSVGIMLRNREDRG